MESTMFLSRIIGPLLIIRGMSIILDREHFRHIMNNLEEEMHTISFAMVPVAIMMGALAIIQLHHDWSSPAAILFHLAAWGAIAKTTAIILVPKLVAAKVKILARAGFLEVTWVATFTVGGYLTWFGYFQ